MTGNMNRAKIMEILIICLGIIGAILGISLLKLLVDFLELRLHPCCCGSVHRFHTAGIIYFFIRKHLDYLPLLFMRDHVIVCGLNYRSIHIVQDLL